MITRLYVQNFRCLESTSIGSGGHPSMLLIGKNGVGR